MASPWRRARTGMAALGLLYGLPAFVAGVVVGGTSGTFLAAAGVALSFLAFVRGLKVDLRAENQLLIVRNRWRTVTFEVVKCPRVESVTPWWMLLARMAAVNVLGVRVDGRRLAVPALATLGKDLRDPPVARLITDLGLRDASLFRCHRQDAPEP